MDIKKLGIAVSVSGGATAKSDLYGLRDAAVSAEGSTEKLTASTKELGTSLSQQLHAKLKDAGSALNDLGQKMSIGITAPVALLGKQFLDLSITIDNASVALGRMLGNRQAAEDMLAAVKAFSDTTSFEFPGLVEVTKQLVGFKVPAEDVINTMRNLGNAAGGNQERLERLALAYGKLNVKGKASMEELNMFLEAGVPILDELSKMFGKDTAEIYKMVETGKIGFNDVNKALQNLTNGTGMFSGILEEQSKTIGGRLSTLKDQFMSAGVEIIKAFEPALRSIVESISSAIDWFTSLDSNTRNFIATAVLIAAAIGPVILVLGQFGSALNNIVTIARFLVPILTAITPQMVIIAGIAAALGSAFMIVADSANEYTDAISAAKEITEQSEETLARTTALKAQEAIARLQNTSAIIQETKAITEYELRSAEATLASQKVIDPAREVEVTRLKDKLHELNSQMMENANASKVLVDAYNNGAYSLEKLTGRTKEHKEVLAGKSGRTGSGGSGTKEKLSDLSSSFEQANGSLVSFEQTISKTMFYSLGGMDVATQNAIESQNDLRSEFEKSQAEAEKFHAVISKLGAELASGTMNAAIQGFNDIGKALEDGKLSGEEFGAVMGEMAKKILNMLPLLFLQAGLQLIANGQWAMGLGFVAAAASTAVMAGFVDAKTEKKAAAGDTFTDQIVTRRTNFSSGGINGVMGENNPEAIIPLKRDATGRLGVSGTGGGSNVTVNVINNASGTEVETTESEENGMKRIDVTIKEIVQGQMMNGDYNKALRSQFKLSPLGV